MFCTNTQVVKNHEMVYNKLAEDIEDCFQSEEQISKTKYLQSKE